MDVNKTGEFLAALRKSQGYTQQEVADHLNISNKTISKWEQGKGYPELTMLPVLAEFYQVSVDEILAGKKMNRQTEPDHRRGAELHRYLLDRIDLHFDLCMIAVLVSVLLASVFAYSIWCTLFNILAAGILLVGILLSNYELHSTEGTLEETESRKIFRTVGQKTFLVISLIMWSALFTSYMNCDADHKADLRAHVWAAICTAVMILLWIFVQKHWGTFLRRVSAVLCAVGLLILNVSAPVFGRLREMIFTWLTVNGYCETALDASLLAYRIILLLRFIGVGLIAVGVVRQLVYDRRK